MNEIDTGQVKLHSKDFVEYFKILSCDIYISIDRIDLKTAKYKYCYTIQILKEGLNQWNETFAYNENEIKVITAHDNEGGLSHKCQNAGKFTKLSINFRNNLSQGNKYYFDYDVETRIDSISNIRQILGGSGAVWFWCSHYFPIDTITAHFKLPRGVIATDTHPKGEINNEGAKINRTNLIPNEFFSNILPVEKKFLGLSASWGKVLSNMAWLIIGILLTELIHYLIKIT